MTTSTKEVRGWRGLQPPAPRRKLDLEEEEYSYQSLSDVDQNAINAKMTLLTCQDPDDVSLYEHLSALLADVFDPTSPKVIDVESLSSRLKSSRLHSECGLRPDQDYGQDHRGAHAEWKLFKTVARPMPNAEPATRLTDPEKDEEFLCLPNLMRQAHLFSIAGLGLPSDFYVRVTLALRELSRAWPVVSLRLWGVVFGLTSNYTVAEAELREGEYETDISDDDDSDEAEQLCADLKENGSVDGYSDDIKPIYKPPRKIPSEPAGSGLNRKVYFVCSQPGYPWIRLPHVTPAQISAARKIRKYFTGDLDQPLQVYPPFPGTEKNYLRAQIARIGASCHISPIGVFKFDEQGEEEEQSEGARDTCVLDVDFEGLSLRELCGSNAHMSWVHHAQYILPQGRTTWFNPAEKRTEGEGEDEDEEEERNEPDEPEPEIGPPLLTPIAEDIGFGDIPAWIVRCSSKQVPEYGIATVQSVIWPGAVTIATDNGRFFENLYVGFGQKALPSNFEPAIPEFPMSEFPTGPEVIETEDPSPETEAAIRAAMREQEAEEEEEEDAIIDDENEGGPDLSD